MKGWIYLGNIILLYGLKMSKSNCGKVERYKGLKEPKCLGGKGCDACWDKYKNPPSYSLPWLMKYRKNVFKTMQDLAQGSESPEFIKKQEKLVKLQEQIDKLRKELIETCPHPIENQEYRETGREDDYGCYKSGMDYYIKCKICNKYLAEWGD